MDFLPTFAKIRLSESTRVKKLKDKVLVDKKRNRPLTCHRRQERNTALQKVNAQSLQAHASQEDSGTESVTRVIIIKTKISFFDL